MTNLISRHVKIPTASAVLLTLFTFHVSAGDPFDSKYPNIVVPDAQFGEYGIDLGQMNEPSDVVVGADGNIYVAECFNSRIQIWTKEGVSLGSIDTVVNHRPACPLALDFNHADGSLFVGFREGGISRYDLGKGSSTEFYLSTKQGDRIRLPKISSIDAEGERIFVSDSSLSTVFVSDTRGNIELEIGGVGEASGKFIYPTSVVVDETGHFYVSDKLHRIQKFEPSGRFQKQWGTYGSFSGEFAEPNDLSYANGKLYVADLTNHRLQAFNLHGEFVLQWGRHPETEHQGQGHTHYPTSISADPNGEFVVVCEQFEYRCQRFDVPKIRNLANVDVNAWWEKFPQFHYGGGARMIRRASMPSDLTESLDADDIFEILIITEPDMHRAVLFGVTGDSTFDADSMPIFGTVGEFGTGDGQFVMLALKAANASTNELYLGDAGRNDIQVFDLETLDYERTLFEPGTGPGEFNGPAALAFHEQTQQYYIADFHNNRIQVFNIDFEYQFEFGRLGSDAGELFGPLSIAFSPDESRIYVTDTGNQRVQIYNAAGNFINSFGHLTTPDEWGEGTFQWPFDVAVANDGSVYVTDPSLQLVQKFDADGNFLLQWGGWGTKPGQFYKCKGIDVDSEGRVYVIDFGNHRGQIFDPDGQFLGIFGEGILYPAASLDENGKPPEIGRIGPADNG